MFETGSQIALITCFSLLVRWCISLNPYSGSGKPPMFGDYEAQRHWMEITYNLPPEKWYVNGSDNNLEYWGLDYPPLTAYHSWLLGTIATYINGSWVDLYTSRGTEGLQHKLFMRHSALVMDLLIYIPAIFVFFMQQKWMQKSKQLLCVLVALLYPGLNLIDHGHFQYNSTSLGLAVWAVIGVSSGHDLLGSVAFVCALNYKQMELYHAMPFFCYLLGSAFKGQENWFLKLLKLGLVVIGTFSACWAPFLQDRTLALQVLNRLFPFTRGLYEDKVANFWCSISLLIKIKNIFTQDQLIKICLGSTLVGLLPSSIHLVLRPSIARFRVALVNASLVFFLFSYQVHEKSILIAAIPVCLLLPWKPFMTTWFMLITTFSMLPLLIKDGLLVAAIGSSLLFATMAYIVFGPTPEGDIGGSPTRSASIKSRTETQGAFAKFTFVVSQCGCLVLTVASVAVRPPAHLPDLFPVLVSAYAAGHFLLFLVYFHWLQLTWTDNCMVEAPSSPVKTQPKQDFVLQASTKAAKNYSPKPKSGKKKKVKKQ